ncbi:bacteriodes thetaiotaomicron symbiotic chitinase [Penicillium verhagenii]|uniref:bacteriodes thetaiotaomicron symbiotic chitinase n=1 Tax=Penicillium verhagenii TaxID=1562060 RepID=UPI002545AEE2|nr:bacteriodes thetaiotaomicron symbiotic chitinase [Penicillium verhagenii]KAJ5934398.1 bacteriodes thetaiotaomicron symbiotic chitinase [Penicillium verhagenii]
MWRLPLRSEEGSLRRFLYGFDGIDLDWEYPAVSDRGGKTVDIVNYVYLVNELRKVFDESGETYGITFTIPTSYWYM